MKGSVIVPIDQLNQEPYVSVLCFPKPSEAEAQSRIEQLRGHGVLALEFSGKSSVFGVSVPVLGKGFVGIVVIARLNGEKVAVKIRRLDADRADLLHEAEMLKIANSVNAAPKFVAASKNFLLMQLIEGELLPAWLQANVCESVVNVVLGKILESCYLLDSVGLDHGELSKAPKHVIIDHQLRPWIVDFETASDKRKPANLPAICHFLFASPGETARTVAGILGERNKKEVVDSLRFYKKDKTQEAFERVIKACLGV